METLECTFADGTPGRLACEVAGAVTCQHVRDGTYCDDPANAGTLYVLLAEGSAEPWQIDTARAAGYTIEVQYGDTLTLPEPEPPARRRSREEG